MNTKFMLTFDNRVYGELKKTADNRGVSVQELLRAIVEPYWMKHVMDLAKNPLRDKEPGPSTL